MTLALTPNDPFYLDKSVRIVSTPNGRMDISQGVRVYQKDFNTPTSGIVFISNVEHLASYNWVEARTPTIAVPGMPNKWSPPTHPANVRLHGRRIYNDQNADRLPQSPLEPLFRALYVEKPSFDIGSVNIIADSHVIRKLLEFVDTDPESSPVSFKTGVEIINNTMMFTRIEDQTNTQIGPGHSDAYFHAFMQRYTTLPIANSTGHYRIISYNFAGLKFLIRHEADACNAPPRPGTASTHAGPSTAGRGTAPARVSHPLPERLYNNRSRPNLTVMRTGEEVQRESTMRVEARSERIYLTVGQVAPRLWISQTPNLVRAYYRGTMFNVPEVEDVRNEISYWERVHQDDLCQLAAVLRKIAEVVQGLGGAAVVTKLRWEDFMVVARTEKNRMLPRDLYSRWG